MQLEGIIRNRHELPSIEADWDELWHDSGSRSPLLSFEYVNHWYECFAEPDQIRVYCAIQDGRLVGLFPMVRRRRHGLRVLSSLSNDHCAHGEPLVRPGTELAFSRLLLHQLAADGSNWDVLEHPFSYSFSPTSPLFTADLLDQHGFGWDRRIDPTYTVSLDRTYDAYFSSDLSAKFRKNLKMYGNRLLKAGDASFEHCSGVEATRRWTDFLDIEDANWKGSEGTSLKRLDSTYSRYYEGFVDILARHDALHLYFLAVDNAIVAAVFGYDDGSVFHYAKIGYDEAHKALSPSNLLCIRIIERLIEDRPEIQRLHMFPWSYGYKQRFANEESFRVAHTVYGRTPRARLAQAAAGAKRQLKAIKGRLNRS